MFLNTSKLIFFKKMFFLKNNWKNKAILLFNSSIKKMLSQINEIEQNKADATD